MKRQITIYESARNGRLTVFNDVECNTLGELKVLLREKGIGYNDMDFIEGVTNTKLMSDESAIPSNIPFKGKTTNNVFINILQKDAKIKSGVDLSEVSRKDLLALVKPYAEDIQEQYNRNFTQVSSEELKKFLNKMEEYKKEDDEEEVEDEEERSYPVPHYMTSPVTLEAIVEAVKRIAKATGVNISDLIDTEGESFFSLEDMDKFLKK